METRLITFWISASLLLISCRSSQPPPIEICILSPAGGGDCVEPDQTRRFRPPSEMTNYWATNPSDMGRWSGWCYDSPVSTVQPFMNEIEKQARAP